MAKKQTAKKAAENPKVKEEAKAAAKAPKIDLIPGKIYSFKSNGKSNLMIEGKIYQVSGDVASVLIAKGLGSLID